MRISSAERIRPFSAFALMRFSFPENKASAYSYAHFLLTYYFYRLYNSSASIFCQPVKPPSGHWFFLLPDIQKYFFSSITNGAAARLKAAAPLVSYSLFCPVSFKSAPDLPSASEDRRISCPDNSSRVCRPQTDSHPDDPACTGVCLADHYYWYGLP